MENDNVLEGTANDMDKRARTTYAFVLLAKSVLFAGCSFLLAGVSMSWISNGTKAFDMPLALISSATVVLAQYAVYYLCEGFIHAAD